MEPVCLTSPTLAGGFFTTCATWEASNILIDTEGVRRFSFYTSSCLILTALDCHYCSHFGDEDSEADHFGDVECEADLGYMKRDLSLGLPA